MCSRVGLRLRVRVFPRVHCEFRRPFEALGFPTVSFQRRCSPTGAATSEVAANHRAEGRASDGTVGSIASQCASTDQRGESESRHVTPGGKKILEFILDFKIGIFFLIISYEP